MPVNPVFGDIAEDAWREAMGMPRNVQKFSFEGGDVERDYYLGKASFLPMVLSQPHRFSTYYNQFKKAADLDKTNDWTLTSEGGATATAVIRTDVQHGGIIIATGAVTDNHAGNLQFTGAAGGGELFALAANKKAFFEMKVNLVAGITQVDAFVGLAISDTTLGAAAVPSTTDYIGFAKDDGDTSWDFVSSKDSTETERAAIHTAVVDTYVRFGIEFIGTTEAAAYINGVKVEADINGSLLATITDNLPDDEELCPTFLVMNGDGVTQQQLACQYVVVAQEF